MRISDWSSDVCSSDLELQPGQTGMSFTLATPAYGVTSVEVLVTDSQGAITRDGWLVAFLPAVDADRDGFWAVPGPDCDDEVAAVNPNVAEVSGNGIDDDCDPATSDDPAVERGSPGSASPRSFRGMEGDRSEEHTSELQSLMRLSYADFCLKK